MVMCQPNLSKKEMEIMWGSQILYQDNNVSQYMYTFLSIERDNSSCLKKQRGKLECSDSFIIQ